MKGIRSSTRPPYRMADIPGAVPFSYVIMLGLDPREPASRGGLEYLREDRFGPVGGGTHRCTGWHVSYAPEGEATCPHGRARRSSREAVTWVVETLQTDRG